MRLVIEGEPIPLQRARRAKNIFYDPQYQAKQNIAWVVKKQLSQLPNFQLLKGPISVDLEFQMPIPKSISTKKHQLLINQPHIKTKDIDNLCKFIFDALNGIVWEDDALIWNLKAKKIYSEMPQTKIEICCEQ